MERERWGLERALSAYLAGVCAVRDVSARFAPDDWVLASPCPDWRAVDVAGHLRCLADNHHEYLDDAPDSRLARLYEQTGAGELIRTIDRQNAAELAALPDAAGPELVAAFADTATRYAERLPEVWERVHHRRGGASFTVGSFAAVACTEWHLHAWDLAQAAGHDYRPDDPEALLVAWSVGRSYLPVTVRDPWRAVLVASGRSPRRTPAASPAGTGAVG
ncbi:MAG: hypothetical protein GEV11_12915 [Streptosporangiales bacterium]|nr:hypothetical protein [Streptosporangiales bacterium]